MTSTASPYEVTDARAIRPLSRSEWTTLAATELQAFLSLLDQLEPGDWERPTACTRWNVRDVVAHQAGHVQMGAGLRGFLAQARPLANRGYRRSGMNQLDALNQAEVDRRRELPIEEVIAELREGTPRSIQSRERMPWLSRQVRIPVAPTGLMTLDRLLKEIFPRDMWIHRLDIADATGKPFAQTATHDGLLVRRAVADVSAFLSAHAKGFAVTLTLNGPAGGAWKLSCGNRPVSVEMSVVDFMRLSSGRLSAAQAAARATADAPPDLANTVLRAIRAPY